MAEETQYTANTGWATISTANSSLDGSGTLGTVLTAGGANGTLIKSVIVKAQAGGTGRGMVRLFVDNGAGTIRLIKEIPVALNIQGPLTPAFEVKLNLDFTLKAGHILKASTEVANTFNVIAEGLDWTYYATSVRTDTTQYTGNTGTGVISVANTALNGSGTLVSVYTAGTSASFRGSSIKSISIKSTVASTTAGMIRLFLFDGVSTRMLFTEVFVRTTGQSGTAESFEHTLFFENDFDIKAGWIIQAATQNAQNFHVTVEGYDWNYLP
jgi:hypothetical protein